MNNKVRTTLIVIILAIIFASLFFMYRDYRRIKDIEPPGLDQEQIQEITDFANSEPRIN